MEFHRPQERTGRNDGFVVTEQEMKKKKKKRRTTFTDAHKDPCAKKEITKTKPTVEKKSSSTC